MVSAVIGKAIRAEYLVHPKMNGQFLSTGQYSVPERIIGRGERHEQRAPCGREDCRSLREIASGEVEKVGVLPERKLVHGQVSRQRSVPHQKNRRVHSVEEFCPSLAVNISAEQRLWQHSDSGLQVAAAHQGFKGVSRLCESLGSAFLSIDHRQSLNDHQALILRFLDGFQK